MDAAQNAAQNDKIERVLGLYTRLMNGGVVNKADAAQEYGVAGRSIQRDVDDIRAFLEREANQSGVIRSVVYDREKKGYRLDQPAYPMLTNAEILAICKILLDSRAFTRPEMLQMLNKLTLCCVPEGQRDLVSELIRNEAFHYAPQNGFPRYDVVAGRGDPRLPVCGDRICAAEGKPNRDPAAQTGGDPVFRVLFLSGGLY